MIVALVAVVCSPIFRLIQLEPDDYRYLELVQQLDRDFWGNLRAASLVENRWDHLWWMQTPDVVRFFRPTVILSYWLDTRFWGDRIALGLLVTNLAIYAALCFAAAAVLVGWFGRTWPVLLATAFFVVHPCHSELTWYIAGRTDSIAGLLFFIAIALHQRSASRGVLAWLGPPLYALALLTKEWCIGLPLVLILHEWFCGEAQRSLATILRRRARLLAAYAAALVIVVLLGRWAMQGQSSALVYPYFVSPLRPDYLEYLSLQLWNYAEIMLTGWIPLSLLPLPTIRGYLSTSGLVAAAIAAVPIVWLIVRDRRARLAALLALLTWLPASVVYISERYMLAPSLALAALVACICVPARPITTRGRTVSIFAALALVLWGGFLGASLFNKHSIIARPRQVHRNTQTYQTLAHRIPRGASVIVCNLRGNWLDAQFTEAQLRWLLRDPTLRVSVANVVPLAASALQQPDVHLTDANTLTLRGDVGPGRRVIVSADPTNAFEHPPFTTGMEIRGARFPFDVLITRADCGEIVEAALTVPRPLTECVILDLSRRDPIVPATSESK